MSIYPALQKLAGLSQREAAAFLDARLDTVKSWSRPGRDAPVGVIDELRALVLRQEGAARAALGEIARLDREHGAAKIELGLAADDHEAQSLGWPCVGAHAAVLARVAAALKGRVTIVSRGSTPATAAAADVRR